MERSLNASELLLQKINADRLPSPTHSTILGERKRQSLGADSVTTDMLLDAKPIATGAPYWSPTRSHAERSLLESLNLPAGGASEAIAHTGASHLRRVNDLLSSMQRDTDGMGLRSFSSESLTVDDVTASGRREREARNLMRKSQEAPKLHWSSSSPAKAKMSARVPSAQRTRARSQPASV